MPSQRFPLYWTDEKVMKAYNEQYIGERKSVRQVAATHNKGPESLWFAFRRLGLPLEKRVTWTEEAMADAKKMRDGGAKLDEIGNKYGVCPASVSQMLSQNKVRQTYKQHEHVFYDGSCLVCDHAQGATA